MSPLILALLPVLLGGPEEDRLPLSLAEAEAAQDPPMPGEYRRRVNELEARKSKVDAWGSAARAPLPDSRANAWHGLFNTPALEDAGLIVPKTFHFRLWLDLATSDWSSDEGGGPGVFNAVSLTETLAVDYAFTDLFQVGVRLVLGELMAGDEDFIRVYQDGAQLVDNGTRGFGIESAVFRVKHAYPTKFAALAAALEVKIPLANEEDLLTAQTIDIALTGIATKNFGPVSLSLNVGIVVPLGDPKVFVDHDEANPYLQGGIAFAWQAHERFCFLAQLEFNSSAWSEVKAIDEAVIAFLLGGRQRLFKSVFATAGIGIGLTDASGDLFVTAGLDAYY